MLFVVVCFSMGKYKLKYPLSFVSQERSSIITFALETGPLLLGVWLLVVLAPSLLLDALVSIFRKKSIMAPYECPCM